MFKQKGNVIKGIINFSPREALEECQNDAIILDIRRENEIIYKGFDVENLLIARPDYIKENLDEIPKNKPVIIADNAGLRSRELVDYLQEEGFNNLANLAGGMFEWDKDQMPMTINNSERMTGSCLCMMRPNRKPKPKK